MSGAHRRKLEVKELAVLERLARADKLTPDNLITEAQKKNSPLRDRFEWDDAVASHGFRVEQARSLIASVQVQIQKNSHTVECVAYVRDPRRPANEQGYVDVAGTLMSDADVARAAVDYEAKRAAAYLARVRALSVALGLEEYVDSVIEGLDEFRERLETAA